MERTVPPRIDIAAFIMALIAAPLLVTALTFWIAFIPVYALVFGGPVYLLVGTPVLLLLARKTRLTAATCAEAGCWAMVALTAIGVVIAPFAGYGMDDVGFILMVGVISSVFATVWAGTFGMLYNNFIKPDPDNDPAGGPAVPD